MKTLEQIRERCTNFIEWEISTHIKLKQTWSRENARTAVSHAFVFGLIDDEKNQSYTARILAVEIKQEGQPDA